MPCGALSNRIQISGSGTGIPLDGIYIKVNDGLWSNGQGFWLVSDPRVNGWGIEDAPDGTGQIYYFADASQGDEFPCTWQTTPPAIGDPLAPTGQYLSDIPSAPISTDGVNTLVGAAACFVCIPDGMQWKVLISSLFTWQSTKAVQSGGQTITIGGQPLEI